MVPELTEGNIVEQKVEVIVNAWNRNIIPWWLLIPQGVSGAIKKKGGTAPFKELAKNGAIPLGGAVLTGAGTLPYKAIIHVAGINMFWMATRSSISQSVRNAMELVNQQKFCSVAFPVIGAGSGSFNTKKALAIMMKEFESIESLAEVVIVRYKK